MVGLVVMSDAARQDGELLLVEQSPAAGSGGELNVSGGSAAQDSCGCKSSAAQPVLGFDGT
jgi:hypothetical protein